MRGGTHATPGDTAEYPLFGTLTPETIPLATADSLRVDTDPIYPPVLLRARMDETTTPRSSTLVLLVRTVANRDRRLIINDGTGDAVDLDRIDSRAFSGHYGPWGIALLDSGSVCATRIR